MSVATRERSAAISLGSPTRPIGMAIVEAASSLGTCAANPAKPGVSTGPGHSAVTRMARGASSTAQERAKLRIAALVAAYTLMPARPLMPTTEDSKTIDAPSCRSGSAFCTVNTKPLTLASKVVS